MSAPLKKVLLVDDSSTVRRMVAYMLKTLPVEILQAENGQQGLDIIRAVDVDLAIVDLNMPVMDGISLVGAVRALPAKSRLPIIMLTTESRDRDMTLAHEAGADLYLVKPSTPSVIRYKVQALLGLPSGEDAEPQGQRAVGHG